MIMIMPLHIGDLFMACLPTTTAATGIAPAAATFGRRDLPNHHDLKSDLLKRQLIAGASQEAECLFGWFIGGPKFDTDGFAKHVGEVVLHLPVEDERDVSVELLLKLVELKLPEIPWSGLEHGQDKDILAGVMGKGIKHSRPLDSRAGRGWVRAGQIYAEGNHT
jgi:hypothetical protein